MGRGNLSGSAHAQSQPLRGVKVVDFTHVLAGPYCTQLLADAGADVIKVEPMVGDMARFMPPLGKMPDGSLLSGAELGLNRGKRSIAVDMKSPGGRDLVIEMIDTADVVIESFAPGALRKLGIDLSAARLRRPSLITLSISLYGSHETAGELANRKGLAIIAEAESGVAWMHRDAAGKPPQQKVPFADMNTGLCAYSAIVTALFGRERSGEGKHIDIAMVKTMLSMATVSIVGSQIYDADNPQPNPACYGMFRAKDGYIALAAVQDTHFASLMEAMGRPDLAADERYRRGAARGQRVAEINDVIDDWTATLSSAELLDKLNKLGIPVGCVHAPSRISSEANLMPAGFLKSVDDGQGRTVHVPTNPLGFDTNSSFPKLDADGEAIRGSAAEGKSVWLAG